MKNSFRGFIGPLGDDIPSIFPIVAGILIFIVSIGFIQQQVSARNEYVDLRNQVLQLTYIATEKGYMTDSAFSQKCDVVKETADKKHVNFTMILKKFCGPVNVSQFFEVNTPASTPSITLARKEKVCSRWSLHETQALDVTRLSLEFPKENTVIMSYPIAVACEEGKRGLGFLSIAGWR